MKKLLVTGYMRSGTTFLSNFLNSQDGCLVHRDVFLTVFITSKQLGVESFLSPLNDKQKNTLLSRLKAEYWAFGSNAMDELTIDFFTLYDLYNNAIQLLNCNDEYNVVGTKNTCMGDWLPIMLEETDVHIIYIYRDIRDVLLSGKNTFVGYNLKRYLMELIYDVECAMQIQSDRFLMIKFEELMFNTDHVLKNIGIFLNVEIKKNIASAKDRNIKWMHNSSFHDIKQLFDKNACFRWKKEPGSKEVKYCEILLSDFIQKQGYDIGGKYKLIERIKVNFDYCAYSFFYHIAKHLKRKLG